MSEALCADCPLRDKHPNLDIPRINPTKEYDVAVIEQQAAADGIMAAISKKHPEERCDSLRNILPREHRGVRSQPLAECPEIGLLKLVSEDYEQPEDL